MGKVLYMYGKCYVKNKRRYSGRASGQAEPQNLRMFRSGRLPQRRAGPLEQLGHDAAADAIDDKALLVKAGLAEE